MVEKRKKRPATNKVRMVSMTAMFVALNYAATSVLMVPSPAGGYLNLGDAVVLLGGYLLGPIYGAAAGGIGAALADILAGYGVYVPATLVIKSVMGAIAAVLYRLLKKNRWGLLVCGVVAETVMVVGYCVYDGLLAGALAAGLAGVSANLVQAVFGIAASTILAVMLQKNGAVCRAFPEL